MNLDGINLDLDLSDLDPGEIDLGEIDLDAAAEATPDPKRRTPADALDLDASTLTVRVTARRRQFYDWTGPGRAERHLRALPGPGEAVHGIMGGDYHGFDLVPAILRLEGRPAASLTITTLGFNERNTEALCALIDRAEVTNAALLCSHYFAHADSAAYLHAKRELGSRGARIAYARNHSKLLLFDFGPGRRLIVETSANLRSCNNLEQFAVIRSDELFAFHAAWINHVFDHAKTTPDK